MKPITGFKPEAPSASFPMLPRGIYTAQIKAVKIDGADPDQRLILRLDITEGEFTAYYSRRYKADQDRGGRFEVKYKGDFAIQIPNEANPRRQHYDWDLRTFNNAIWAIEDSNPGYHFDWNEQALKGKKIGINVRGGTYNGSEYTTIGRLESTRMMAEGKCRQMPDAKPRGEAPAPAQEPESFVVTEDVPF